MKPLKHIAVEVYALNFSQFLNMAVMAISVPWIIGLENYGIFAAAFALPGVIQSFTEALILILLTRGMGRTQSVKYGIITYAPLSALCFSIWFYFENSPYVLWSFALLLSIVWRTAVLSPMLFSGKMTTDIVISELIISVVYTTFVAFFAFHQIGSVTLPFIMIIMASCLSTIYLMVRPFAHKLECNQEIGSTSSEPVSFWQIARLSFGRSYEDGFLTVMPLVLAQSTSAYFAGQFRVLVSIVKAAYKLFPLRYDIVLRELAGGTISRSFVLRSILVAGFLFPVCCLLAATLLGFRGAPELWILVTSGGFTVATLALFPAAYTVLPSLAVHTGIAVCAIAVAAMWGGAFGFSIVYGIANLAILGVVLVVLTRHQAAITRDRTQS